MLSSQRYCREDYPSRSVVRMFLSELRAGKIHSTSFQEPKMELLDDRRDVDNLMELTI